MCHAMPSRSGTKSAGASDRGSRSQNVTPAGETQIARAAAPAGWSCSDQPSRRLATSNECRAGTRSKRWRSAAASTVSSESGGPRSSWPVNGSTRRRLARRASAAQAMDPRPSAISSGRWSPKWVEPTVRERPTASSPGAAAPSGTRRCHPGRMWSGSTNRTPSAMSRPRLSAAIAVQSAPSPPCSSAMVHKVSPGRTASVVVAMPCAADRRGPRHRAGVRDLHGRRCARSGARRECDRSPDRGEREDADGDARREPVHHRSATRRVGAASADMCEHAAHQLRAAGDPGHPGGARQHAECVAGKRMPRVTEPSRTRGSRPRARGPPGRR